MRIIAGLARGLPLTVPRGDATRPTSDRVREAIFSSLGARVTAATVLDLFAGTGALGLEALSRGAQSVVFVEQARTALDCLAKNLAGFQPAPVTTTVRGEVLRELARMAGVHVYCETGDVISGRDGFTSIHATAAGEKTLIFPKATKLRDLISGETLAAAKTHRFTMQAGDTRLFGWK